MNMFWLACADHFARFPSLLGNHFSNGVPRMLYSEIQELRSFVEGLIKWGCDRSLYQAFIDDIERLESALHLYRSMLIYSGPSKGSAFLRGGGCDSVVRCEVIFNPVTGSVYVEPSSDLDAASIDSACFGEYASIGEASRFWVFYFG